ncbi:hypothetical protein DERP_007790 [Dermatophagoides pteronyssinus]|uniref:Uncharacterized protein n=1 Tax=Dermatophagoides pteronyssinus TaxID=6956 RepID=A0ABQ8ISM8_DERPT|nr:hypothetical protein DERP_007790 [Dermatophagoides pteronyssinus]
MIIVIIIKISKLIGRLVSVGDSINIWLLSLSSSSPVSAPIAPIYSKYFLTITGQLITSVIGFCVSVSSAYVDLDALAAYNPVQQDQTMQKITFQIITKRVTSSKYSKYPVITVKICTITAIKQTDTTTTLMPPRPSRSAGLVTSAKKMPNTHTNNSHSCQYGNCPSFI